ncbi:MAG: hypothetical protein M3142_00935 [Bacteroidota bacterium]|nr:hypothetical protein [Bacteroidota bacterium]
MVSGCEKTTVNPDKPNEDIYQNSPSSAIPNDFKDGIWFWGNTGSLSYYDYDGNNVGNAVEAGRQYQFKEVNGQGRLEFQQYLGNRNASNCVTEVYTHKTGTVKFEGTNKFTFYPVEGTVKIVKTSTSASCPKGTTDEKLTQAQLTPTTELYEIRMLQGKKHLYVFEESDVNYQNPIFVYQITG